MEDSGLDWLAKLFESEIRRENARANKLERFKSALFHPAGFAGFTVREREFLTGGMAVVCSAYNARGERRALKLLALDDSALGYAGEAAKALREIDIMIAVAGTANGHPHLVRFYKEEKCDEIIFAVLEWIDGETLGALAARRAVTAKRAVEIALAIGGALSHLHAHGVIHRDVTPRNVMVATDGRPVLIDLGLAYAGNVLTSYPNPPDEFGGTLHSMSPEQANCVAPDVMMDVFGLGATLRCVIYGRGPYLRHEDRAFATDSERELFQGEVLHRARAGQVQPVPERPDVPEALRTVLAKATASAPQDRYQTVDAFADALGSVLPELG